MVTFALPGDDAAGSTPQSTPRSRAPLPFANRSQIASSSPYGTAPRRQGTPHTASRKTIWTRDDVPSASLNRSFTGASNLFATSTLSDNPPASSFSPSFSQTPQRKVFAPGATPEPSRVQRDKTAQPAARGIANKMMEKDLFTMRIDEPSKDLSGEALVEKIPAGWDARSSIYADEFLQDSCPPEYDDLQRRQWFCILDLRRLKYSANEVFAKKGWKLNIMNFAKEYEKSRSFILLHYGLYEFRNVKPSKELTKKWRRDHGLPPLEDDEPSGTPAQPVSTKKKRKASVDDDDEPQPASQSKRRATENDGEVEVIATQPHSVIPASPAATPVSTPLFGKNKRKASEDEGSESQPSKKPSSTRALFESIASKTSTTPSGPPPKTNMFSSKPTSSSLMQNVLKNNAKADVAQSFAPTGNIFGHLSSSDNSGKNSEQDADDESASDSPSDDDADEGNAAQAPTKAAPEATGTSSDAGTRESTPGRSLFERISKGSDGEPASTSTPDFANAASKDQTWNPSTTPLKFGPTTSTSSTPAAPLFGNGAPSSGSSLFAPKTSAGSSNLFGAPKQDKPTNGEAKAASDTDKDGDESDKENDASGPNQKALPEPKPQQPSFGSLFAPKPDATKETEPAKPASSNMFGAAKPSFSATEAQPSGAGNLFGSASSGEKTNLFGAASKPAESTPVMQSSTLFGAKPTEPEKKDAEPAKPIFGTSSANDKKEEKASGNLFGNNNGASSGNLFGGNSNGAQTQASGSSSSEPAKPLFGGASATAGQGSSSSPFTFGQTSTESQSAGSALAANKPMFGAAPKSPPQSSGANNMPDGSPMKQDDKSPAKAAFGNNGSGGFSFGSNPTPSAGLFGANSNPPASNDASSNGSNSAGGLFGSMNNAATTSNGGGGSFNFQFGGGGNVNNPFASQASSGSQGGSASTSFDFNAGSSTPSAPAPFSFNSGTTGNSAPPAGGIFGANKSNTNGAPAFGAGSAAPSGGATFSFGAGSNQGSQPSQPGQGNNGPAFLQPPAPSSTGTNTPSILGGGSSLATTPARGTPEPSTQAEGAKEGEEEGEKHEQINLASGAEEGEEVLHEVRAKALKYVKPEEGGDKPKSKSPWTTQGVGQLRLLKNKETGMVRLLLRAEPRGNIAMNRALMPDMENKVTAKYVNVTTADEKGDKLETWMVQVKTEALSKALGEALDEHKSANKK